ncbi:hypothetical protein B0H16DRAFT_1700229 [Mycena metata]|uniref:Uncharacterized protein n=1 Tax=Mycena metata TaxID=1033252 RepID=A0AAD7HFC4_9AGAR|nr:hypothetical protein B0H16DRAFT_1700229 [Mycena metata]
MSTPCRSNRTAARKITKSIAKIAAQDLDGSDDEDLDITMVDPDDDEANEDSEKGFHNLGDVAGGERGAPGPPQLAESRQSSGRSGGPERSDCLFFEYVDNSDGVDNEKEESDDEEEDDEDDDEPVVVPAKWKHGEGKKIIGIYSILAVSGSHNHPIYFRKSPSCPRNYGDHCGV